MDDSMIELLDKIHRSTSFMAVAGALALMFLLVFAQSIFGARTTHSQLKKLHEQTEQMNHQLKEIADSLKQQHGKDEEDQPSTEDHAV